MHYMLLILEPIGQREARSEAEGRLLYERMQHYATELQARGLLRGAESLASQRTATRVGRVSGNGTVQVLDGPFAEAKEMVGGYFLLDCANREQAVDIARACPAAEWATIEVREFGPCFL
ncbi:YciI family protein [Hylemonella sp. W303a]|uniref:YciI family protein n=1 Tax=Hylemonella sp. W303a TaxID=3389873 RepID=UPI00396AFB42